MIFICGLHIALYSKKNQFEEIASLIKMSKEKSTTFDIFFHAIPYEFVLEGSRLLCSEFENT